jgi:hypothetical protein
MTREHLINTILSAVFPGDAPLAHAHRVRRILGLVEELADVVGPNESQPEPSEASLSEPVAPVVPGTTKPLTGHRPQGGRQGTDWSQVPDFWTSSPTKLAAQYAVSQSAVYKARAYLRSRAVTPERQAEVEAAPLVVPAVVSILERTAPPSVDRQRELDAIEKHVKTKGVNRVPSRYVEPDSIPANPKGRGGLA